MARRNDGPLEGAHFCGDSGEKIFHDLDKETPHCCIDEIIESGNAVAFETLFKAINSGYDFCKWCIGGQYKIHKAKENSIAEMK